MMKTFVLSRKQVRLVDQIAIEHFGVPGIILMENAAQGCVNALNQQGCSGPVVVCCGTGNNGGDGFAIARLLTNQNVATRVIACGNRSSVAGDALINLKIIEAMGLEIIWVSDANCNLEYSIIQEVKGTKTDWVIDALLGTGAVGAPRQPMANLLTKMNSVDARRLAIDIPSGLDCDTGFIHVPTFAADITCTFVGAKTGFVSETATAILGSVQVIPIGCPVAAINMAIQQGAS